MSKRKKFDPPVVNNLSERFATEVAELRNTEIEINRVNHTLQMLSDANQALKEQYSTLRSIIDSTNALIFSVDRQYKYTCFNKGHAAVIKAIYGGDIEINHSQLDYMTVNEDREKAQRNIDRALAGEQFVEEAYSGEELKARRYFQVSHSPIKTEEGEVVGVVVIAQDLTERKQADEKIKLQFDELLRWQNVTLNREQRVGELKREVNKLSVQVGEPIRYPSQEE